MIKNHDFVRRYVALPQLPPSVYSDAHKCCNATSHHDRNLSHPSFNAAFSSNLHTIFIIPRSQVPNNLTLLSLRVKTPTRAETVMLSHGIISLTHQTALLLLLPLSISSTPLSSSGCLSCAQPVNIAIAYFAFGSQDGLVFCEYFGRGDTSIVDKIVLLTLWDIGIIAEFWRAGERQLEWCCDMMAMAKLIQRRQVQKTYAVLSFICPGALVYCCGFVDVGSDLLAFDFGLFAVVSRWLLL